MHQIHFVTAAIDHQALPNSSGNLAIFAAILRASSLLSNLAGRARDDFAEGYAHS
jgi:hypothetical protein